MTMGLTIVEQLKAEGRAEGRAEGLSIAEQLKAEGEARGEAREARRFLLRQLRARFGELPDPVMAWVEEADLNQCEEMGVRLLGTGSLAELGISGAEDGESSPTM
jgi:uncharacterized protein DUF4351